MAPSIPAATATLHIRTQLLHDIRGPHDFKFDKTITTSRTIVVKEFVKSVLNKSITAKLGVTFTTEASVEAAVPVVTSATAKHTSSLDASLGVVLSTVNEHSRNLEYELKETSTESVSLTKHKSGEDDLSVYQIFITGPGVVFSTDGISTVPINETVTYKLTAIWEPFLVDLNVLYGEDKRTRSVAINTGGSSDLNKGFEGEYVYVEAIYGTDVSRMITDIHLHITPNKDRAKNDLARGTQGAFRYLDIIRSTNSLTPIRNLRLHEGSKPDSRLFSSTIDINKGREGRYLYLAWE